MTDADDADYGWTWYTMTVEQARQCRAELDRRIQEAEPDGTVDVQEILRDLNIDPDARE